MVVDVTSIWHTCLSYGASARAFTQELRVERANVPTPQCHKASLRAFPREQHALHDIHASMPQRPLRDTRRWANETRSLWIVDQRHGGMISWEICSAATSHCRWCGGTGFRIFHQEAICLAIELYSQLTRKTVDCAASLTARQASSVDDEGGLRRSAWLPRCCFSHVVHLIEPSQLDLSFNSILQSHITLRTLNSAITRPSSHLSLTSPIQADVLEGRRPCMPLRRLIVARSQTMASFACSAGRSHARSPPFPKRSASTPGAGESLEASRRSGPRRPLWDGSSDGTHQIGVFCVCGCVRWW